MINVITVADQRFLRQVHHLKQSLVSSNNNFYLTVYCDHKESFADLVSDCCAVVEISDMTALGAKRAKITAFRQAIDVGSFLYLDADAIVLEPLDELCVGEQLTGCPDDLSHCPFIEDKRHPWPNAKELCNDTYINSGVFFAPAARRSFFEELYQQSRIDSVWNQYIFPDILFDNHFLCAFLNLKKETVRLVDEQLYDWQGFMYESRLQVERRGNHLVNKINGKTLRIVLFAGIQQSWDFLFSLPADVASLLFQRIVPTVGDSDEALADWLASGSPHLASVEDAHTLVVLQRTIAELRHLMRHTKTGQWRGRHSYFEDPESMRALSFAQPAPQYEWNGLKCGGAYLDGDEYSSIRDMVRTLGIQTVVETGAGETSLLFSQLGIRAVSVESQPGPWLERARARGCAVLEVPFSEAEGRFADEQLRAGIRAQGLSKVDLLFIDSPVGTIGRQQLLSQFMSILSIRYVLYHDALRDAVNIFLDQQNFRLRPVTFMSSGRGLILLENQAIEKYSSHLDTDAVINPMNVRISVGRSEPLVVAPSGEINVRIELENLGANRISSRLHYPVVASYHWLDSGGDTVVFDGHRTVLPCDIFSGDCCSFLVNALAPAEPGQYELQITMVQEQVCWFHEKNPACLASVPVEVRRGAGGEDE